MKKEELMKILERHVAWLKGSTTGERADLTGANLTEADLTGANLSRSNLTRSNLTRSNLTGADLSRSNLTLSNLTGADLTGANLDYSSGISFHCGGSKFRCDMKLLRQVLAHLCTLKCDDPAWPELRAAILPEALKSHRAADLGLGWEEK
jgi:hypothetical protein